MYIMFCEKNNFQYEVVEEQAGEEAGIKSATLHIKGEYAYGYLKNEKGVHRLVRISPFDAGRRRHTSFASVSVTPEYNTNVNIEIKESDYPLYLYLYWIKNDDSIHNRYQAFNYALNWISDKR